MYEIQHRKNTNQFYLWKILRIFLRFLLIASLTNSTKVYTASNGQDAWVLPKKKCLFHHYRYQHTANVRNWLCHKSKSTGNHASILFLTGEEKRRLPFRRAAWYLWCDWKAIQSPRAFKIHWACHWNRKRKENFSLRSQTLKIQALPKKKDAFGLLWTVSNKKQGNFHLKVNFFLFCLKWWTSTFVGLRFFFT